MSKTFWSKKAATALLLIAIRIITLPLVTACPSDLVCGNFTNYDKIQDCNYIVDQNLEEEQELLCILWDQEYGYDGYNPPEYPPLDPDLSLDWDEIDTSSFILTFKIILFLLFNYFVFSVLTKSKWAKKWLAVS